MYSHAFITNGKQSHQALNELTYLFISVEGAALRQLTGRRTDVFTDAWIINGTATAAAAAAAAAESTVIHFIMSRHRRQLSTTREGRS